MEALSIVTDVNLLDVM